jgi:ketosteroid isomerase-like protein
MSQEQELLVRKAMGAVNEGDIETIVAMIGPETEYELVGGFADLADQPVLKGPEAVRRFFMDWFETFKTTHVEPTNFVEAGDRLLVLAYYEVTTKESDTPVRLYMGQIYSFDGAAISRVAAYHDRDAAIEAARLSGAEAAELRPRTSAPPGPG